MRLTRRRFLTATGTASVAVVLGLQPTKLHAAPTGSGSGNKNKNKIETANKGEFRFYTHLVDLKQNDTAHFELKLDDASLSGVLPEHVNGAKEAIKNWMAGKKGDLSLSLGGWVNQTEESAHTSIYGACRSAAVVTLPAGMVFAAQTSITASPARSWQTITNTSYDETAGDAPNPAIASGPANAAITTITKPDTAPEVGLWITASTTPTTATAEASFNWKSDAAIEVGIEVTGTLYKVVEVGGNLKVSFKCAPVSVTCDVYARAETELQKKVDVYERTVDRNGNVVVDWHLVKTGNWALIPTP